MCGVILGGALSWLSSCPLACRATLCGSVSYDRIVLMDTEVTRTKRRLLLSRSRLNPMISRASFMNIPLHSDGPSWVVTARQPTHGRIHDLLMGRLMSRPSGGASTSVNFLRHDPRENVFKSV